MNRILRSLSLLLVTCILLGCGEDVTSDDHVLQAREFLKQSNDQAAIAELKNALQKDVQNTQARALLGTLYFETGLYEDADKELSRALSMGTEPSVVVPVLAQVLLGLGDYDRLDSLTLDGLDPKSKSTVQAAKGLSMMHRGNMDVAEEILDIALQNEPSSYYAQVAEARLMMERGEYQEARGQLFRIFLVDQKYAPAWNLLGDIESAEQRPKQAEDAYTRVIKLTRNSFDAQLNRAMMRIYQNNYQGASQDLAQLRRAFGPARFHPGVNFASGLVALQAKRIDQAAKLFQNASEFSDAYPQTWYYLAAIYLEKGLFQQALSSVNRFLGLVPDSAVGAKLAAKLELGQKSYNKAEALLTPVVAANPDDIEALNLLASALLAQGKSGEGVSLLAKVAELQPDSTEAKARLGAGFIAAGSESLGIELLHEILEKDPGYEQADVLIVLNYLRQKEFVEAIRAALEYRDRNPDSATSYDLLGRAYLANHEQAEAENAFKRALELRPGDPGATNSLAELALQRKEFQLARDYYGQTLAKNPKHLQTRMKVAASYALEGKEQDMLTSLDSIIQAFPREMEPRLVKARFYIAKGRLEEAMPLLEELSVEQKEQPDALVTIAGFQLASGRYNQALGTLGKLIDLYPQVSQYHYMRAKAFAGLGNIEQLSVELERTVKLDPDHFYAKIALARLALLSNQNELFEKQLLELRKMVKDNPDVIKLEVAMAQKKGDNDTAAHLLEMLFDREPTTGNAIALATHKQAVGNINGAIEQLQHWVADHPSDVAAREKLAEIYGSSNKRGGVIYQYQQILKVDPDHIIALNNLAWYLLDEDPEQALAYAERAAELSPHSSSILDTLAMTQLKNGKLVEARRSIDRAITYAPERTEILMHQAQILAAVGDTEAAIESLHLLLDNDGEFVERPQAEALMRKLKVD
ncbi:MAG: PEP-CTERM system TPR-repeat protein PrsT [Halioglobus sp.]